MITPKLPNNTRIEPVDAVLRRPTVRELLGVSNSTLHAWIKAGRFPAPLELGPRVRGWRRSVVEAFLASCEHASKDKRTKASTNPCAQSGD